MVRTKRDGQEAAAGQGGGERDEAEDNARNAGLDRASPGQVLLVDDDEDVLVAGRLLLKRQVGRVVTAKRPEEIPALIEGAPFDAILLDMNYGLGESFCEEGFRWLRRILDIDPQAVVIPVTAYGDISTAVEAMKEGATDFVIKPWQNEKFVATVRAAVRLRQSRREVERLRQHHRELAAQVAAPHSPILYRSGAMAEVMSIVARAAPTEANVLILGENGTGKELVAREIHRRSPRAGGVFMAVDLGAVPEGVFEGELFGHRRGAFTGARDNRVGRLQAASGGTLFLDEIGNLPLHLQAKLLTVLERRCVTPVGANEPVAIDVRVVSATNASAEALVDPTRFRQDLVYRLNTVELTLPPLRQRREDIALLLEHYLALFARKYGKPASRMGEAAVRGLIHYDWPGNVRALRHALERAVILGEGEELGEDDFHFVLGTGARRAGSGGGDDEDLDLERIEKATIKKALRRHQGNVSRAAADLGVTRTSLYRRMEKYGL